MPRLMLYDRSQQILQDGYANESASGSNILQPFTIGMASTPKLIEIISKIRDYKDKNKEQIKEQGWAEAAADGYLKAGNMLYNSADKASGGRLNAILKNIKDDRDANHPKVRLMLYHVEPLQIQNQYDTAGSLLQTTPGLGQIQQLATGWAGIDLNVMPTRWGGAGGMSITVNFTMTYVDYLDTSNENDPSAEFTNQINNLIFYSTPYVIANTDKTNIAPILSAVLSLMPPICKISCPGLYADGVVVSNLTLTPQQPYPVNVSDFVKGSITFQTFNIPIYQGTKGTNPTFIMGRYRQIAAAVNK